MLDVGRYTFTETVFMSLKPIYMHFASCFDYVCGEVSCLPKLEINGLLM